MGFLMGLIPGALKGLWNLGATWLDNKRNVAEIKGQLDLKKATLENELQLVSMQNSLEKAKQDGAWESIQAVNSNTSLKDEWWTLILSLPMFLVTISPLVDVLLAPGDYVPGSLLTAATAAVAAYDKFPDWYVVMVSVAIGAAFGVRIFDRFRSKDGRVVFVGNDPDSSRDRPPVKPKEDSPQP